MLLGVLLIWSSDKRKNSVECGVSLFGSCHKTGLYGKTGQQFAQLITPKYNTYVLPLLVAGEQKK